MNPIRFRIIPTDVDANLIADLDRIRRAMEDVLFDGRLPPDLAAAGARSMAKMCGRVLDHALRTYWVSEVTATPA